MLRIAILIIMVGVNAFAQATPGWQAKALDQWNDADIKAIMSDSPWGRTIAAPGRVEADPQRGSTYPATTSVITLRSALIVRYALIRKLQIKEKYEAMDAKQKAEFNKKYRPILECLPCEQYYVVSITSDSELFRNEANIKSRQADIFLANEKGDKRMLANVTVTGSPVSETVLYFPRNNDKGEPLISPANSEVKLSMNLGSGEDQLIRQLKAVTFKVADLVREGRLVF